MTAVIASTPDLREAVGRPLGAAVWIIVAYLVATRVGGVTVAKVGVEIGGVPIFATEIFLIALAAFLWFGQSGKLIVWVCSGSGAGMVGVFVWVLTLAACLHAALAFPKWRILALRDLAIFLYPLVFPLTYFALDSRRKAEAVLSGFIYSGAVLAITLMLDASILGGALYSEQLRQFTNNNVLVKGFGGGDVGGMLCFTLAALLVSPGRRGLASIAIAGLCFLGFAITQTRSASVGLAMALVYSGFALSLTGRVMALAAITALALGGVAIVHLLPNSSLATTLDGLYLAIEGGAGLRDDADFEFRYLRWRVVVDEWLSSPVFGVGFGKPLVPDNLISPEEVGLNAGLPHNTYLTILARMGLFGLVLILAPWVATILGCLRRRPGMSRPDRSAAACGSALMAMAGFAGFVLFFERPMHNAALWIVLAVACRLRESPTPLEA